MNIHVLPSKWTIMHVKQLYCSKKAKFMQILLFQAFYSIFTLLWVSIADIT